MKLFFKRKKMSVTAIFSPVEGQAMTLKSLNDGVFSAGFLGQGVAIMPKSEQVFAPLSGTLVTAFPTLHAYGITTKSGVNVLIHLGIDTVALKGKGFTTNVKQGQEVQQGDLLGTMDLKLLEEEKLNPSVLVIVTQETGMDPVELVTSGDVTLETQIMKVEK